MRFKLVLLVAFVLQNIALAAQPGFINRIVSSAAGQVERMVTGMDTMQKLVSPRTLTEDGKATGFVPIEEWTSGFFPGTLWYLYELTGDAKWYAPAVKYTEGMERIKHYTGNHDIGFMIYCSFGNGLRLTSKVAYEDVIVTAAQTLSKRFRNGAGIIQSWNKQRNWLCPVIIDNMMNLELLFEATRLSGDSVYWNIAVSHADQTMKNHYRGDMSCCHVVDYDPETGVVRGKYTAQGYSDSSAWARGQAWGLYGYTLCYRYTKDERYLEQALKITDYIFGHVNMPEDLVPYWDYDAPLAESGRPRDASAAAIVASALYELSAYCKDAAKYKKLADKIVLALASPAYMAEAGENGNFILMHSTGSIPHGVEIDVPLVYADYYFLEALKRKRDLEK